MANQKLTDRNAATSAADSDLIHIVDVSDTTDSAEGTSKKITKANFISDVGVQDLQSVTDEGSTTTSNIDAASFNSVPLYKDTDDSYGVGTNSLANNTGVYSNGFGYGTLLNNTGNYASGFGYVSLFNNTGAYSSGFGKTSLYDNTGDYACGFGDNALKVNKGDYSCGFGAQALWKVAATSSNLTAIGHQAGYSATEINFNNSTAIGANSLMTASNQIMLGDDAITSVRTANTSYAATHDQDFVTKKYVDDNVGASEYTLTEDATVTGTHDIDWDEDTHYLTLTGNTTFTESNLPATGYTKTITIYASGDYTLTLPSNWDTNISGSYDGTVLNQIVIEYIKSTVYWMTINQAD